LGQEAVDICLHRDMSELQADWLSLQEHGLCTFYQTYEWCAAWHETAGKARGIKPLIISGRLKDSGKLAFILPFSLESIFGVQTLRWFSSEEVTYGMGVFDRQILTQNPKLVEELWPQIIDKIPNLEAINLEKQPAEWDDIENPLRFLFTNQGASQSFLMALQPDFDALYGSKRSSSSRRSARKRDKKLHTAGRVQFGLPDMGPDTANVINAMFKQQKKRLGMRGIRVVFDDTRRVFMLKLSEATNKNGDPVLLPYNLSIDNEICSVMLGSSFQSTYWALSSSLTSDTSLYPLSPGDHTLRAMIKDVCQKNYRLFDFSAGAADYKSQWSEKTLHLLEANAGVTVKGKIGAFITRTGAKLKRTIKQSPALFSVAKSARKLLLGRETK